MPRKKKNPNEELIRMCEKLDEFWDNRIMPELPTTQAYQEASIATLQYIAKLLERISRNTLSKE